MHPHTRHGRWISLLAVFAVAVAAIASHAGATPMPKVACKSQHPGLDSIDQVSLGRMRALRAWRIITELKLDEASSTRVLPIFTRYDERDLVLIIERREITYELRTLLAAPRSDDAHITRALDRLAATQLRRHTLHDERLDELRRVLPPVQQGRLLLLLPGLERDFAHWGRQAIGDGPQSCDHASPDEAVGRSTSERAARRGQP